MLEIKGFKLLEELYNSNNSIIYRAEQINNDNQENIFSAQKKVILKILKENFPSSQELTNYKQEFEITNSNFHQGIIRASELIKYEDKYIIVFEDIDADSLNNVLKEKCFKIEEFFKIAIEITEILWNIHQNNIIHKDINPANIILNSSSNQLKIIDFGISTRQSQENLFYNNIDVIAGTLAYMSPEQTGRMNRALDYRTDFYSLGLTLYELLTGHKLFYSLDPLELIHFHIARELVLPDEFKDLVPDTLWQIILKMIAKNPEDRYQSAFGIKVDLEKCLSYLANPLESIDFKPGENDLPYKFYISQKLYGREKELETLFNTFEKVKNGSTEFTLVTGYSGIGKTSLIQKIYKPILKTNSYFCKGKFEQFHKNIPYSAISQACSGLIKQLLSQSEATLENWKIKLNEGLGANAQIIIDLVPELETIIGKQEAITQLNPTESRNRFQITFTNFIKLFASKESPVVFFLDDLQWSDTSSLNLIQNILLSGDINYFFLLGAYRDNEVDAKHTLMLTLETIKEQMEITSINLHSLSELDVNQLIADTLSIKDTTTTLSLAKILYEKTAGNPFFISQLLKSLL